MKVLVKKIILALAILLLHTLPAAAAVSLNMETLAQHYKVNSLVNLKVTVANTSAESFTGKVIVTSAVPYRPMPPYVIKVDNLVGTKEWTIKIPQEYLDGKIIGSLEKQGKSIKKTIANYRPLREMPSLSILYLVPSGNAVPQFLLNSINLNNININGLKQYTELRKTEVQREHDFFAYDIIVLEDIEHLDISTEQWEVITRWVNSGGTLIIPGGELLNLPKELIPAKNTGTQSFEYLPELEREMGVNLPRGSVVKVQTLEALPGASVMYAADNINWITAKICGEGTVIALPVRFTDKTFISWQGSNEYWQRIIKVISKDTPNFGYQNPPLNGQFGWVLQGLLPTQMPNTLSLVLIFVAYVLLVGFGSYFVLRRLDRRGSMWLSVPLFSIVFFVSIYYYGASQRSNEVIVAETGSLTLYEDHSRIDAGIGLFVPKMGDYSLTLPGNSIFPSPYEGTKNMQLLIKEQEAEITFENMAVWSMQAVQTSIENKNEGNFKIEKFATTKNKTNFTVINDTNYNLENVFIGRQDIVYFYTPQLKKGETVNVVIDSEKPKSIYEILQFNNVNDNKTKQIVNMKVNLLSNALQEFKVNPQSGLVIAGFTKELLLNVKVNNKEHNKPTSLFLVRQNLKGIDLHSQPEGRVKE